ncbi:putative lipid II flippase FtsW [Caulobacter sp. 17J65-9]|uniref:putative lipid II flippase FtsW n=1 Tax=Caulobacter sp. 17J65-9 TaxID=2709382 RepID=UPI0013C8E97F|nr:putative lipid II flippase FtsW [Caulobacter sp. 17J65-9]
MSGHYSHTFQRTDRSALAVWFWTVDRYLLGAIGILIFVGVALSFASSPAAAHRIGMSHPFHFALRQAIFATIATGILVGTSMMSPKGVRRVAVVIYALAIISMLSLPFVGHAAKGATRWIQLGPFSLQPSEFLKPALITLAAWMFAEGQRGEGVPGVSIAFGLYLTAVALLLIQPDIGQTVLITVAFMAAFFMAGVPVKWILGLGTIAVGGLVSTYFLFDHVAARVQKFLSPDKADTHQIDRASEAIAAGGLFGRGPGEGVMKRHVPDLHTDFIYSVGAEEFGLIFSLFLIGLFGFIVVRGLYKAMRLSDPFEQVAAAGLFVLFAQQAIINVAVNLNLIPTKGMTLPFISYGGSSMLAMGLTLGLALALTRRRPGAYSHAEGLSSAGAFS